MTNHSASASLFASKVRANLLLICAQQSMNSYWGYLRQVLVDHITIGLYAPQEVTKERFNRADAAAVVFIVVIEEISDVLQPVHQSPNILLIIMSQLGAVIQHLYPHLYPGFVYVQYGLHFQKPGLQLHQDRAKHPGANLKRVGYRVVADGELVKDITDPSAI